MTIPVWYPEWRHDAFHELQAKNADLEDQFHLGSWPRWDYDQAAGTLTFSEGGVAKVIARIQVAGTTSNKAAKCVARSGPIAPRPAKEARCSFIYKAIAWAS